MDKRTGYEQIHKILLECFEIKRSQDLWNLITDMGLIDTEHGLFSHDQAVYYDYSKMWDERIGSNELATKKQVFAIFKESVLDLYEKEFGFEIDYATDYLKEKFLGV
jgi:hypothetical protein